MLLARHGLPLTRCGRLLLVGVAALLASLVSTPSPAAAQSTASPALAVAPSCVPAGSPTRILILGVSWPSGPVALSMTNAAGGSTPLGTATPQPSLVGQQAGSFSFVATVQAPTSFRVSGQAQGGQFTRTVSVTVQGTCPFQVSVKPPCLSGAGTVQVSGTGFNPNSSVSIDVDPYGPAQAPVVAAPTNAAGAFTITLPLPAPSGVIPILVSQQSPTVGAVGVLRAVVFVDPCPPPSTTTTSTTSRTVPPSSTSTTVATTTTSTGSSVPPLLPPATVPGTRVRVSISPNTVRPGRCAVLVIADASPAAPVVARFADGPNVNAQTGPDGRAVVSVCVPHDSGNRRGVVDVVVGICTFAPAPLFQVLRVPPRPQPPLGRGTQPESL